MKKGTLITIIFIVLVALFLIGAQYFHEPGDEASVSDVSGSVVKDLSGEKLLVDASNSHFEFEGYAVGKSHVGTFDDYTGSLILDEGEIIGATGTVNIDSINTGIGKLDSHLKNDDFFDIEKYPTIKFTSTSLDDGIMTGHVEFKGVTKEVSFPIVIEDGSLSANFFLDVTPFNFKYTGINKDVRIAFDF